MFFVHDDDAQIVDGCKKGRACSDDDIYFLSEYFSPLIEALSHGHFAVENGNIIIEGGAESVNELWSECDFGHENESVFLLCYCVFDCMNIDECFSAAGYAME